MPTILWAPNSLHEAELKAAVEEVIHYDDGTATASWHWTANEHIYMDLLPKEEDNGKPN